MKNCKQSGILDSYKSIKYCTTYYFAENSNFKFYTQLNMQINAYSALSTIRKFSNVLHISSDKNLHYDFSATSSKSELDSL